jgi:hypothetical protein
MSPRKRGDRPTEGGKRVRTPRQRPDSQGRAGVSAGTGVVAAPPPAPKAPPADVTPLDVPGLPRLRLGATPPVALPRGPDPDQQQRWLALWETWLTAPLHRKLALARSFIEESVDLDPSIALELMLELVPAARRAKRSAVVQALADLIAERHPRAYAEESFWFDTWRVENGLRARQDVRAPLLAAAARAADRPEPFADLLDQVLYFGRAADALESLRAAWPALRAADVAPASKRELSRRGAMLAAAAALADGASDVAGLRAAAMTFVAEADWATALSHQLLGAPGDPPPAARVVATPEVLALEFAATLQRDPRFSAGRFVLAHDELVRYLSGGVGPDGQKAWRGDIGNAFSPARLESYLGDGLGMMGAAPYRAATLAAALPSLLALMRERGIVTQPAAWRSFSALRDPVIGLAAGLAELTGELDLARAIVEAWEAAPPALSANHDGA